MRKPNQLISKILTAAMLFGTVSITAPALSYAENAKYVDVENHWARTSIERWSDYEIVNGNEIGEFLPDANMTRGQLAKVLATLLGLTETPADNPFSDVPEDEWYAPFMLRCYDAGIILGLEGMGRPEAPISRQESMVMIARALGIEPIDVAELSDFSDASGVEPWAAGYVAALISKGIVSGVADNILAPTETINRASVMTVLDRSIGQYINSGGVHELVENPGIVLVVSGDVTLTGTTEANLIISSACAGKTVAFDGATVTGTVTVQTDSCVISENNSSLPEIKIIGTASVIGDAEKPEEVAGIAGGGGGAAGGGGGGFTPSLAPVQNPSLAEKLEALGLYYEAADSKATSIIKPQVVEGKAYLFLPSSADYSGIYFTASDTTELRGTVQGVTLNTTTNSSEKLDLTAIFGVMNPGTQYPMKAKCGATECEIILMKGANIPSLHITLDESRLPSGYDSTIDYIHADKSNKLPGNLVMVGADGSTLEESLKQLKGRGNSTWRNSDEKRPYNIKLNAKQELIENAGAAKNWCLLSNNTILKSGIPNAIAYKTYEVMEGNYAIANQSVDLYIDNEYRGVYFLTEKVEIDSARVNIKETKFNNEDEEHITHIGAEATADPAIMAGVTEYQYATNSTIKKQGGYLLEIDPYSASESSWFKTRRGVMVTVKNPEFATKEQVQKIAIFFQEFEDALYSSSGFNREGKHYSDYIDIESWVKQYAIDCFTVNWDMMGGSSYAFIDVDDDGEFLGKLNKGPAWDYDGINPHIECLFSVKIGMNVESDWAAFNNVWASQFLRKGDFVSALNEYSEGVFKGIWRDLCNSDIDMCVNEIRLSQAMNDILWLGNYGEAATYYKNAFSWRYGYWYDTIWSDANLKGVTVSDSNGTLTANVSGAAMSYQWYRCDSTTPDTPVAIGGATAASYTPTENGIYYVAVTGGNIGYNHYTVENLEKYTINGVLSSVADMTITMHSNAIEITGF